MNIPWLLSLSATPSDLTASDMYCESCASVSFGVLAGATKAEPHRGIQVVKSTFRQRRNVRQRLCALFRGHSDRSQCPRLNLSLEIGIVGHNRSDRAGKRRVHCRRRIGVGHISYVDLGIAFQELASDVNNGCRSRTAVRNRAWLRCCELEVVGQSVDVGFAAHSKNRRRCGDIAKRFKTADGIVVTGKKDWTQNKGVFDEQNCRAVRRRARREFAAEIELAPGRSSTTIVWPVFCVIA